MVFTISHKISRRLREEPGRTGQGKRVAALAALGALTLIGVGGARLTAQVEGDRGIAPVANTTDIQVNGIDVDVSAKTGADARLQAWKLAEQKAWKKVGGPDMPVESIDAMVSSIVIEHEEVGDHRYIAKLGVIFDRTRAGQYIGGQGAVTHSAPMLVIPVLYSGGVRQVFEVRGPWQRAWAEFQASSSPVDYVRPIGSGGESLVLNAGQPGRRSRLWWSTVLGQFDAADVVTPIARLERQWPGGPIKGTFTARYGLDNTFLGSFTMTAGNDQDLPAMLEKAVERVDGLYRDALTQGLLKPDPTLASGRAAMDRAFDQLRNAMMPQDEGDLSAAPEASPTIESPSAPVGQVETVTVQFATPDAAAVDSALAAVRGVPGVQGAATVSLAIGGTSVMRVSVAGGAEHLAGALRGQGWKVSNGDGALKISR